MSVESDSGFAMVTWSEVEALLRDLGLGLIDPLCVRAAVEPLAMSLRRTEHDLLTVLSEHMEPCGGDPRAPTVFLAANRRMLSCLTMPAYRVTWSDRISFCCDAHLEATRWAAAHDSASDCTENPHVEAYAPPEVVARWWPRLTSGAQQL